MDSTSPALLRKQLQQILQEILDKGFQGHEIKLTIKAPTAFIELASVSATSSHFRFSFLVFLFRDYQYGTDPDHHPDWLARRR